MTSARERYVLIVDDNPASQRLFTLYVEQAGHAHLSAHTAQEAIDIIQMHGVPPLILMDVRLPDMSGLELTRRLREMPELSATRIVGISALALAADRQAALEAGMDGYWAKPASSREAIEQIRTWLADPEALG